MKRMLLVLATLLLCVVHPALGDTADQKLQLVDRLITATPSGYPPSSLEIGFAHYVITAPVQENLSSLMSYYNCLRAARQVAFTDSEVLSCANKHATQLTNEGCLLGVHVLKWTKSEAKFFKACI